MLIAESAWDLMDSHKIYAWHGGCFSFLFVTLDAEIDIRWAAIKMF